MNVTGFCCNFEIFNFMKHAAVYEEHDLQHQPSQSRFSSLEVRANTVPLNQRHRTTVIDENSIREKIKSRLNLGNACYRSAQNVLYSAEFLCGFGTFPLILGGEYRLKVFEKRVLRRIS
jgi:hypothetical protein